MMKEIIQGYNEEKKILASRLISLDHSEWQSGFEEKSIKERLRQIDKALEKLASEQSTKLL